MNNESASPPATDILLVDDTPANLQLLTALLQKRGYRVRPVPSGELALQAARSQPPDLILLDIDMPGMNGFEVCKCLKADERLTAVPVIFISALSETMDKVKGFSCGAVDFVTKPFKFEEVDARVRTHLELARLRKTLKIHNAQLEETVARRTRELAEANARLAILDQAKSEFLTLISHEVRTPLCGVFGVTEILLDTFAGHPALEPEYTQMYEHSRRRLLSLIDDALLLSQIGAGSLPGESKHCRVEEFMLQALAEASIFALSREVRLAPAPSDEGLVWGAPKYLARALQSLLETAVKFACPGTTVRLTRADETDSIRLAIEAEGHDIPPAVLPQFFDLLSIAEPITPGGDLGFGPPVAERIVSLYGGKVLVENLQPPGIRLTVHLKIHPQPTH